MRYLAWIMVIVFAGAAGAAAQTNNSSLLQVENEIFELVNAHRKSIGLGDLKPNSLVAREAAEHSKNMQSRRVKFGHDGFDTRTDRLSKRIKNIYGFAENVALSGTDAEHVVNMWLHSPGHKKNIEGDYNVSGIGAAMDKNGQVYYTQIFLKVN